MLTKLIESKRIKRCLNNPNIYLLERGLYFKSKGLILAGMAAEGPYDPKHLAEDGVLEGLYLLALKGVNITEQEYSRYSKPNESDLIDNLLFDSDNIVDLEIIILSAARHFHIDLETLILERL